jgi:molybdopterin-guanine dinucleotide biosynthesis protein A
MIHTCAGECTCHLWKSQDGRTTPLCMLSTQHLINILKMAARENRKLHPAVFAEAQKRIDQMNAVKTLSMENPDGLES